MKKTGGVRRCFIMVGQVVGLLGYIVWFLPLDIIQVFLTMMREASSARLKKMEDELVQRQKRELGL